MQPSCGCWTKYIVSEPKSYIFAICVKKRGWGFENFLAETNTGKGIKMPRWVSLWLNYGLPLVVLFLLLYGLWAKFAPAA